MKYLSLLLILFAGCNLELPAKQAVPIIVAASTERPELIIDAPTSIKTTDIIVIDASKSVVDSLDYKAVLVANGSVYKVQLLVVENGTKAVAPHRQGRLFVTVSGCKGGVIKSEIVEILVEDVTPKPPGPGPGPGPEPKPDDVIIKPSKYGLTEIVVEEATKIGKPAEAAIILKNITTVLSSKYETAADLADAFRVENRKSITVDMRERWDGYNKAITKKLESLNLQTLDENIEAYVEMKTGLERVVNGK